MTPATSLTAISTAAPTTTTSIPASNGNGNNNNDWMLSGIRASNEKLRLEIKRLKKDLEAERKNIKELFVLHQGDLRQVRQQEQDRAQALLSDLKTKLNQEKIAEVNKQKEKLNKDHEVEMIKLTKEHQDHIWKLSTDKKKEKEHQDHIWKLSTDKKKE